MAQLLLYENQTKDEEITRRLSYGPWILWRIWKARNDFCLKSKQTPVDQNAESAINDATEWQENQELTIKPPTVTPRPPSKWMPPKKGTFKCNVDASWKEGISTCSVAWILRDDAGNGRWVGTKMYPSLVSSLEAEAAALTWAMAVVDNLGFEEVVFESDSRSLIQAIEDPMSWPRLQSYIDEINGTRRFLRATFSTCCREAKEVADSLAKSSLSKPMYSAFLDYSIPAWLSPMLEKEKPCVTL